MIKHVFSMVALATTLAAPAVLAAQEVPLPPANAPACDCPLGDSRGDLRNLAAFAPLGLLGALAAAGGVPALYAGNTPPATAPGVATTNTADVTPPPRATDPEVRISDPARNATPEAPVTPVVRDIPEPVSPDSLRAGIRAPNTGTPLPSVLLLGVSLVAVGSVTVLRSRG
jgi:hypothetical protein